MKWWQCLILAWGSGLFGFVFGLVWSGLHGNRSVIRFEEMRGDTQLGNQKQRGWVAVAQASPKVPQPFISAIRPVPLRLWSYWHSDRSIYEN